MICVTHELDLLEAHLIEHEAWVEKFFIKTCSVSWNRIPVAPIDWSRYSRFNIEVIEVPENFYTPIPDTYPSVDTYKWYRQMQTNRRKSKHYQWDRIAEGCDFILHTDVDEIIRDFPAVISNLEAVEYLAIKLSNHSQWVNFITKTFDLYRLTRSDLPYTENYKGRPRTATETTVGWHLSNCFKAPEDFRKKLLYASALPTFAGVNNVPTIEEIKETIQHGDRVYIQEESGGNGEEETLSSEDLSWAPKFVQENKGRFLWK